MVFSSMTFLFIFLPVTLVVYHLVPQRLKNAVLLIASLFFYSWGEPVYIILMLLSILYSYFVGKDIYRKKLTGEPAKRDLVTAVIVHLVLLGIFKYTGLFLQTFNHLLPSPVFFAEIALPIGISFYTFQIISYLIDVYRGTAPAQEYIVNYALYVSMFPQLIAGPIVRYADIDRQLRERKVDPAIFGSGVRLFITGLAKKAILANGIGRVFDEISGQFQAGTPLAVSTAWLGTAAYALQIYFDFSGYSDMAIGLGRMFGFELKINFNYPYISKSVTEFWRRWHISLGTWFREYVYIPLGGNRLGTKRQILNLLIVWCLTGFWHGAAWNFLFWGLYYGIILVLEKFIWGKKLSALPDAVQHLYTLVLVCIAWPLFFSPDLSSALHYTGLFIGIGSAGLFGKETFYLLFSNWLLWTAGIICSTEIITKFINRNGYKSRQTAVIINIVYVALFLLSVMSLITGSFNPFLYFRF